MARHPTDAFIFAHADWECGREGAPCRFGPEGRGRCPARAECLPQRTGDRWQCRRPLARGGPCEKGPLPDGACCFPPAVCVPRATPRRKLRIAWQLAALCALAVALALLLSRPALLPGPVLSSHAAFENDCGQCHVGVAAPSLAWAKDVFAAGFLGRKRQRANAARCIACHDFGAHSLAAHSAELPAAEEAAARRSAGALETRLAAAVLPAAGPRDAAGAIACSVCHREHEGRDFDATAITDGRCQVCHRQAFDGFAAHPPFTGYPHRSESRIAFDHAAHFDRHFVDVVPDRRPVCSTCHTEKGMAIAGFSACTRCHEREISSPPGYWALEFLAAPGLDLEALAEAGIGAWPEDAEAQPNAFLRLLLEAGGYLDPADFKTIAAAELMDLTGAGDADLQAAAKLAWAFKELTRDLVREGPTLFVKAAQRLAGADAPVEAELAGSLPFELVRHAAGQWFPELASELERRARGEAVPTRAIAPDPGPPAEVTDPNDWLRYGGWRFREQGLRYRPAVHADRFVRAWMTLAAAPGATGAALLAELGHDWAPSASCVRCHVAQTGNDGAGGAVRLNWFARASLHPPDPAPDTEAAGAGVEPDRHLRPFSHPSHRQAVAEGGCVSCHRVAAESDPRASAAGFEPVAPAACAACHQAGAGLASCLTCHRYHFESDDALAINPAGNKPRRGYGGGRPGNGQPPAP